jgi:L,D-transpeptidase YcbB
VYSAGGAKNDLQKVQKSEIPVKYPFIAVALFCAAPVLPAAAQAQAAEPAQPVEAPVVQAPIEQANWSVANARELLAFIQGIGKEGLDPAYYDPQGLEAALTSGDPLKLSEVATDRFNRLSSDLALGRVRAKDRIQWTIKDPDLDRGRQEKLLRWALYTHSVAETLSGLAPKHPQYTSLKRALEVTPATEKDKIKRIRLNMDRWRWLPQDLGERYIIVNVPAYTAALVQKGETVSRHRAVAGKISTPTPQLSVMATGVILNPWWEIPKSLEGDIRGKPGYVAVKDPNGKVIRWRQPPGPANALGQLKFVMPNSQAIYLHDTNAKSRFNSQVRAYSAGCIRTMDVVELATKILTEGGTDWTEERVQAALASGKPVQANFAEPIPVYIVYMSSAAHVDGRVIDYADVYRRDGKAVEALLDAGKPGPSRPASAR